MIRELTKSALSFSWALSLLGVKQAVNLGRPGQQNGGGDLFAPVTQMAVGQLEESMKGIYRSGDNLGSRAVDLAFCWLNPLNWFNASSWTNLSNWANPSNWINPSTWTGRRSAGNCKCGRGTCRCGKATTAMGQAMGEDANSFAQAFTPTTGASGTQAGNIAIVGSPVSNTKTAAWGPMPCNR
jgi:hypothetical protein